MNLNFERAQRLDLKGKVIRYRNKDGELVFGKVVDIKEDGLEISELGYHSSNDGFGFGFFGPGPFFGRPFFVPFVNFSIFSFFFF